jgi:hypothetical protein
MDDHKNTPKYYLANLGAPLCFRTKPIKPTQTLVTFVSPFRMMRCQSCSYCIPQGTKFRNAPKTPYLETDLGIESYLLHVQCHNCKAPFVLHTDSQGENNTIVSGATMGFEVGKSTNKEENLEQRLDRLERELHEQKGSRGRVMELVIKQEDAQTDMAAKNVLEDVFIAPARREITHRREEVSNVAGAMAEEKDEDDVRVDFRRLRRKVPAGYEWMEPTGGDMFSDQPCKKRTRRYYGVKSGLSRKV